MRPLTTSADAPERWRDRIRPLARELGGWPAQRWLVAAAAGLVSGLAIGVPTGITATSLYHRMTPVTWWDYPFWAVSSLLLGLTAATYVRVPQRQAPGRKDGRTIGATLLSVTAVGCPICNKLVVALIGVSGALNYFAPIQPILGLLSLALLSVGLVIGMRSRPACPVAVRPRP